MALELKEFDSNLRIDLRGEAVKVDIIDDMTCRIYEKGTSRANSKQVSREIPELKVFILR
jgi:hypothetical protein